MSRRADKNINNDLSEARDRLIKISEKVKRYIQCYSDPSGYTATIITRLPRPSNPTRDPSLREIHDKLKTINSFLKGQVASDTGAGTSQIRPPRLAVKKPIPERFGVGLDLGTSYIVAGREIEGGSVFIKNERNAFLSVRCDQVTKDLLTKLRMKYAVSNNVMYALGRSAFDLATIFNREVQRSMSYGILNPREASSIPMLKLLIQNILWNPREEGEICCFSIPAAPVDREQNTVYHKSVFDGMLKSIGFQPTIIDEGYAVVLSELEYNDFTGIGISCGGGLINICAAFKSVPVLSFSISRGGDWIDSSVASALGIPAAAVTVIKERGMNIKAPAGREEEAIAIYYRDLIHYILETMSEVFSKSASAPQFRKPVDIVFAGGTSMIGGFLDVVKEEIDIVGAGLPLGDVLRAEEPFTSVVRGCLFSAVNAAGKRNKRR
jgi:hypothetical protein